MKDFLRGTIFNELLLLQEFEVSEDFNRLHHRRNYLGKSDSIL